MTDNWYKLPLTMTLGELLSMAQADLHGPEKADAKRAVKEGYAIVGFGEVDGLATIELGPKNRSPMAGSKLAGDLTANSRQSPGRPRASGPA